MGAPGAVSRTGRAGGFLRGLSGVLAGGTVVLVVALLVAGLVALRFGVPGPGAGVVVGHAVAATIAMVLQLYADRTAGVRGALAAVAAIVVVAAALAYEWLI